MLRITPPQIASLAGDMRERLLVRLRAHARRGFDDKIAGMTAEDLDAALNHVADRAEALDLTTPREVFMLANIALIQLPDPDRRRPPALPEIPVDAEAIANTRPSLRFDLLGAQFEALIAREAGDVRN